MGWPVVVVAKGGIPVSEAANGLGTPLSIAANGYGTAVTVVGSGGLPVVGSGGAVGGGGASGWPDGSNTGVPAGTTMTPYSGDYTTISDGQVISGYAVTNGTIQVAHSNVTVQRCSINTTGIYGVFVQSGKTGCIVQDCTISGAQTAIQGFGTFRRNNLYGVENGVVISNGSGVSITDNYIHDLFAIDPHYDGIACHGGCNNILIQHNWISGTASDIIQGVFLTDEFGAANNIVINDNYIGECTYNLIANGALTAVTITNNLLKEGVSGFYNVTAATPAGNISTRGYYIDGDVPPVVGTVAFTPSNLITAGADRNNDTGFRIAPTLAQAIATEFRITLYAGDISAMGLDSVWFGKASSGQTATAAMTPVTFGGSAAALSLVQLSRFIVSDWMPKGALSFPAGSVMLIGFSLRNPGGTGLAVANSNVNSYFGATGSVAQASPGYTLSSATSYGLARIETR